MKGGGDGWGVDGRKLRKSHAPVLFTYLWQDLSNGIAQKARLLLGSLCTDKPFKHYACTVSAGEAEVGESGVQGRPQLNGGFKTSPCLKKAISKSVFP